ncbi:MAG: aminoacyl-tRNA hydrolase [Gammaproteobacteria bacterium]
MAETGGIALIAGLGNPGARYAPTRHNAGFWFIRRLRREWGFALAREARFHAEAGAVTTAGRRLRVMTPATFMNESGRALSSLAAFYRIAPREILVVHDEIDLPPGAARLKRGGGHGGHNGLRDITARLGSSDFARLRIGVGHPGAARDVSAYVLSAPGADDLALIESAIERARDALDDVLAGEFDAAMQKLHTEPGMN